MDDLDDTQSRSREVLWSSNSTFEILELQVGLRVDADDILSTSTSSSMSHDDQSSSARSRAHSSDSSHHHGWSTASVATQTRYDVGVGYLVFFGAQSGTTILDLPLKSLRNDLPEDSGLRVEKDACLRVKVTIGRNVATIKNESHENVHSTVHRKRPTPLQTKGCAYPATRYERDQWILQPILRELELAKVSMARHRSSMMDRDNDDDDDDDDEDDDQNHVDENIRGANDGAIHQHVHQGNNNNNNNHRNMTAHDGKVVKQRDILADYDDHDDDYDRDHEYPHQLDVLSPSEHDTGICDLGVFTTIRHVRAMVQKRTRSTALLGGYIRNKNHTKNNHNANNNNNNNNHHHHLNNCSCSNDKDLDIYHVNSLASTLDTADSSSLPDGDAFRVGQPSTTLF